MAWPAAVKLPMVPEPPFALNVTVNGLLVHRANRVMFVVTPGE